MKTKKIIEDMGERAIPNVKIKVFQPDTMDVNYVNKKFKKLGIISVLFDDLDNSYLDIASKFIGDTEFPKITEPAAVWTWAAVALTINKQYIYIADCGYDGIALGYSNKDINVDSLADKKGEVHTFDSSESQFREYLLKLIDKKSKLTDKHDNKTVNPEGFLLVDDFWYPKSNFTGKVKLPHGAKTWYKNDKIHRDDGPAVENPDGSKYWFKDDKKHRDDGPAIEYANGTRLWYKNGKQHRDDGPAVENPDGSTEWWYNGKLHREDGPAVEYDDGSVEWWYNDKKGLENFPLNIKKKLARISTRS